MTEWLLVLASIALTLGTALFVAAEFALVALDRPSVEKAVERGDTGARSVLTSLRALSTQLSASQVGITLTTLVLGFLANPSIGKLLLGPLASLGLRGSSAERVASVLALVIATVFSMIIGEMVPKTLAISTPLATAKWVAGPVRWFALAFKPFIHVLNGTANSALRAMGVEPQEELSAARSPAELASLVRTSAEAGTLDLGTARLVTASLTFGAQTAADVMTPRSRATAIDRSAPVIDDDWDDVDGVVHVKKAIAVPHERRDDVPVSALMTPPLVVPETIRLDPLLIHLRDSGQQFAIVVDEYGGTSGVVTLEDLVEEIVGEVSDEHDRSQTTGRQSTDGSWTVPGLWRPDEVKRRTGITIPEGPAYETVAGFLMSELGRVPAVGDVVELPGWHIEVIDMHARRVDRLRFTPVPVAGVAHAESGDDQEGAPA